MNHSTAIIIVGCVGGYLDALTSLPEPEAPSPEYSAILLET
ncbi:hypothetical protein [Candidatus Nitrotoga arctica]|nr:hypothetical protein [Candidatus Nitrotoga arctica]